MERLLGDDRLLRNQDWKLKAAAARGFQVVSCFECSAGILPAILPARSRRRVLNWDTAGFHGDLRHIVRCGLGTVLSAGAAGKQM